MEKGARIAAVLSFLAVSPAAADLVYVPCDLPLAHIAPVLHFKAHLRHPLHRHHRHRHPVGKRGRVGLHFLLTRGMCPIFVGDLPLAFPGDLGGPAGEGAFGGEWLPFEDAGTDLGGWGFGWFGGFGGGGGGFFLPPIVQDVPPVFIVEETPPFVVGPPVSPPWTPWTPWTPCPPAPPVPTPVPEPSTWALILAGFAALMVHRWSRRSPSGA